MGFLDKLVEGYQTINNQLPAPPWTGGPNAINSNMVIPQVLGEMRRSVTDFGEGVSRPFLPSSYNRNMVAQQVLADAFRSGNNFRSDVDRLINPLHFLTEPLIQRSLSSQKKGWENFLSDGPVQTNRSISPATNALNTVRPPQNTTTFRQRTTQKMADSPQGRAALAPDRISDYDLLDQYAVSRNLTKADLTVPFQNARTSQEVTNKTVPIVLRYLAKEGVEISPEVAQTFAETADDMLRRWYADASQTQIQVEASEYYQAMSDMVMELQRQYDAGTTGTVPTQTSTQTSTLPQGTNATQAAFQTGTDNPPQSTLPQRDFSSMEATSEEQLVPTMDMMTWNGGYWGDGQAGLLGNSAIHQAYLGWLENVAQPTWDKTPEGYLRYIFIKNPELKGGT